MGAKELRLRTHLASHFLNDHYGGERAHFSLKWGSCKMWLEYLKGNFSDVTNITRNILCSSVSRKTPITKGLIRSLHSVRATLLLRSSHFPITEQIVRSVLGLWSG